MVSERPRILGRYELLGELGQGAMGVVYKARDPVLDRIVAIKTINLTLPKDELGEYEGRFYQEARAAGGLNHPNILIIYDIGKSERIAYMAMEMLEGEELRSVMTHKEALPLPLALDIACQVAEGLAYAHERHVIHRDIKPANIMIVRDGLVKITDFGIARMRTNEVKTMTGMILGSPKYMSPEQVAGRSLDHRSDIFSLGVVLYEMLTGEAPFAADSVHGIMYQVLNRSPQPPSARNAQLPAMIDLIVAKAINKNPDQRYDNAQDMAQDLRDCMEMLSTKSPNARDIWKHSRAAALTPRLKQSIEATLPDALALANGFDSREATMRLAAMTGMHAPMQTNEVTPSPARSDSANTWERLPALDQQPATPSLHRARYLWIGGGLAYALALLLYFLSR